MAYDLVIFDCDGVLVDSEPIVNGVLARMLEERGAPLALDEVYRRFMGRSMASTVRILEGHLGGPLPPGFVEEFRSRSHAALRRDLRPVRGVVEALERIAVPVCVASSGEPEKMRTTLGVTGLLPRFEGRLFSAVEVARGKPCPDVFLHAAESMGAAPRRCAVVEDTPVGVEAGVAAGMTVFGYAAICEPARLAGAGARVFERMSELPRLLAGG